MKVWFAPWFTLTLPLGEMRAVGPGRGRDGMGIDGEAGRDGVVGGDVGEGVAGRDRAHEDAVHQDVGHVVVGGGGDGEGLVRPVVHGDVAAGRDGPLAPAVAAMVWVSMAKVAAMVWLAVTLVKV